jgi:hypothetical protein
MDLDLQLRFRKLRSVKRQPSPAFADAFGSPVGEGKYRPSSAGTPPVAHLIEADMCSFASGGILMECCVGDAQGWLELTDSGGINDCARKGRNPDAVHDRDIFLAKLTSVMVDVRLDS